MPYELSHGFSNGGPMQSFYQLQQPQHMNAVVRNPDFVGHDPLKDLPSWGEPRASMADPQDKTHVSTNYSFPMCLSI